MELKIILKLLDTSIEKKKILGLLQNMCICIEIFTVSILSA